MDDTRHPVGGLSRCGATSPALKVILLQAQALSNACMTTQDQMPFGIQVARHRDVLWECSALRASVVALSPGACPS